MSRVAEKLENASRILFKWSMFIVGIAAVIEVPFLIPRILLEWTQNNLPLALHIIILTIFFILLVIWALAISGERGKKLFSTLYKNGIHWPILFSLPLLVFSIPCFASLTNTLSSLGYISFDPQIKPGDLSMIQDFYLWHFLESIPGLKIPETLLWNVPFKYKDGFSGLLLLAFKLAVILPVIGSFSAWNATRKEQEKKEETKSE